MARIAILPNATHLMDGITSPIIHVGAVNSDLLLDPHASMQIVERVHGAVEDAEEHEVRRTRSYLGLG